MRRPASPLNALSRRLPLLIALALGLLVLGPGLWRGTTMFLGKEYVDAWGTQWFYWFVGRQIEHGEGIGHTDLLFFPWGKEVYLHTGANVLDAILAWPIRWVLGPVAGYNVWVLVILATNGWAMRSLLRDRVGEGLGVDVAAVLFAFNPYVLFELRDGRPTQALLVFFVLFWRDYLRLGEDPSRRLALRAGLWLALAGLVYWYYALFAGLAAAAVAVVRAARDRPAWREQIARHALAGVAALCVVAPFAFPMLRAEEVPGLFDVSTWTLTKWAPVTLEGKDVGVYVFDPRRWVSGFYGLADDDTLKFIPEDRTISFTQAALAVVGLRFAPAALRGPLVAMCLVSGVVALGPSVNLWAVDVPNLPYLAMVWATRLFQRLWWPSRALAVTQVALAVLAAVALARITRPGLAVLASLGIAGAWAYELRAGDRVAPMAVWPAGIPEGYRCLAEADEGAVIELPYAHTQAHLYFQTIHGRPVFGGMVEDNPVFAPAEQRELREKNTFVAVLIDQASEGEKARVYDPADRAAVEALGYEWVLLDKRAYMTPGGHLARVNPAAEGRPRWVRKVMLDLLGAPVWEDDMTAIYAPWGATNPCPDRKRVATTPR
ncbi:MAG: hypothetical protein ACOZNI_15310 [Myxococcota bacterium]